MRRLFSFALGAHLFITAMALGQAPARQKVQHHTLSEAPEGTYFAEPHSIASSGVLLSAVMRRSVDRDEIRIEVYRSTDAGSTWQPVTPDALGELSFVVDPWLGAGDGNIYLVTLARVLDPRDGKTRMGIHVYRSSDRGLSWTPPALVPFDIGWSYDKTSLAVDSSGNVHVVALQNWTDLGGNGRQGVVRVRSTDQGESFEVVSRHGPNSINLSVGHPPVLTSDDTLWTPYFEVKAQGVETFLVHPRLWLWGLPAAAPEVGPYLVAESVAALFPTLAVDRSELHPDRLYIIWTRQKNDRHIYLASLLSG